MVSKEEELFSRLLSSFRVEAKEHLQSLSNGLIELEKEKPQEESANVVQTLFRAAHSLKGAARAVNLIEAESLCQVVEDVLARLRNSEIDVTKELIDHLFESVNLLEGIISGDQEMIASVESTNSIINTLEKHTQEKAPKKSKPTPPEPQPLPKKTEVPHTPLDNSIRISAKKIDRLLQHVEEMLMIKLTSSQKVKDLQTLQQNISRWNQKIAQSEVEKLFHELCERHSEAGSETKQLLNQMNLHFEIHKEFSKEMRDTLNKLIRLCDQDHRVICGMVDSVINDTKDILMQPFSTLLESFPKLVRDLAQSLGKEIVLETKGDDIEVDRRILEKLKDPLIHVLRNCIDHGIELPEERKQKNKSEKGQITISTKQMSGNTFEVVISDDGKGIDAEKIKEKAFQSGILSETEKGKLSEEQALQFIFRTGFSTSPIVTELSGRGVGLNILAENVEKLGGEVQVKTDLDQGTTFKINMPLSLATFRGIHVSVDEQEYVIPTHNVVRVLRVPLTNVVKVENRETITLDGITYSYVNLGRLLGLPSKKLDTMQMHPIMLIKGTDTIIAFGVDAVLNEQEVFVKGLGKQLVRVKNLAAATIMEWGKVIPILDPFDLIDSASKSSFATFSTNVSQEISQEKMKSILIAEDSITSRMLLKNILESAGYQIKSTVDGAEAFSVLQNESFDLIVSDVEMPRMTGFELTKKVRQTENYKNLPIILCTSRGSKEDREYGIEVGANAYLDKSSFKQSHLLEIIQQLI